MIRIPEPDEVMNERDQSLAYARADFTDVNQGFTDRLVSLYAGPAGGRILDLGCGPADIPIRVCRALPEVRITAVDASGAMIDIAGRAVANAGLAGRIDLVRADLRDLRWPAACFDAVISNSLLHHLGDPMDLWRAIERAASPGALFLVMDLIRPDSPEQARTIVETHAAREPEILKRDFFNSLLAAYTPDEVRAQLAPTTLGRWTCEIASDRHIAAWGGR